jgi:hypothetical protein
MIIDSGTDLLELALPHLGLGGERRTLISIAMDDDLHLWSMRRVTDDYDGKLSNWIPQILDSVDDDLVRYFATIESTLDDDRSDHELMVDDDGGFVSKPLEAAAAERGLHHLSHLFVGPEKWCSTGPMYGFESYGHRDIPRVLVVRPAQYERARWTGERIRNEAPTLAKQLPLFSSTRRNDLAVREGHRAHA